MDTPINKILLKPRFKILLNQDFDKVLIKFREFLKNQSLEYKCILGDYHFYIDIPKSKQKIWSPQLEIIFEKLDNQCLVRGLFAPKPEIWTFFIFLHFIIAISFFIFFALAYANYIAEHSYGLWLYLMISCVVIWFILYFIGQLGKLKAKSQMMELKQFLKYSLESYDL